MHVSNSMTYEHGSLKISLKEIVQRESSMMSDVSGSSKYDIRDMHTLSDVSDSTTLTYDMLWALESSTYVVRCHVSDSTTYDILVRDM